MYETKTFTDINRELINFRHVHVKVLSLVHVPVFTIEMQYNNWVNKSHIFPEDKRKFCKYSISVQDENKITKSLKAQIFKIIVEF